MSLSYATNPGDLDHLIADDHAVVERQFQHLEAGRGDRRILVDQLCFELALHADAEERTFYPALAKAGFGDDSDGARAEHQQVKELCATLTKADPGTDEFEHALGELVREVRHHVAEEETSILPELRREVGADAMAELGRKYLKAKRTAPTYAHPHGPSSGLGHKLADAAAVVTDKVRDRASGRRSTLATDRSGLLDEHAQAVVDGLSALNPLPQEVLTPEEARKQPGPDDAVREALSQAGESTDPRPVGSVDEVSVPTPGGDLTLRVYRPEAAADGELLPVVLWIHGGGWVLFDLDTYDASCRGVCAETGAVVVSPDYRRAPENPFPAAYDDVLAAYRWVAGNAQTVGGDPARVAIGGESVGGTMAAATCLELAAAGEPLPVAQVLVYPLVTAEQHGPSMDDAADARPLNRPLVSWMAMHAFEDPDHATDPRVALLDRPAAELAGLPPTLVITAERDPLRSQGEDFAQRIADAGGAVTHLHYDGVMHEFFGAAAVIPKAADAQQQVATFLTKAFAG